ncbi:MAG: ribosomal protein S18-alanine N-acetyltransferase [Anaerolineaceae bacterium]|nr:ribosomal protein S18-alanine N-acetyltransferase [Anaerolineaceae bacterium]
MVNEDIPGLEGLHPTIRRMRLEDVPAVTALDQASFTLPWTERSFRFELTQNPNSRSWVCEITQTSGSMAIVAMLVIWLIVDEAHIATLAVDAAYQRRSLGRRLLAQGLWELVQEGAHISYLEVRRSNTSAQQLYRMFGYEETGVRPRYYKDNFEDAILMTLPKIDRKTLEGFFKKQGGY